MEKGTVVGGDHTPENKQNVAISSSMLWEMFMQTV